MDYRVRRQLTAAIENVPGRLAEICRAFEENGVNIEGLCVVDSIEQGVIRIITSRPEEAKALLQERRIYVVEADVLVVEMTDQPGTLALIASALAREGINIDYLYGTTHQPGSRTRIVFKLSDLAGAQPIFRALEAP